MGDSLLAAGLALPILPASVLLVPTAWRPAVAVVLTAAHAAIALRRMFPASVFAIVSLAMAVVALMPRSVYPGFLPSVVVFPVALYTLCAYGDRRQRMAGIAVGLAGAAMLTWRTEGGFWDRAISLGMLAVLVFACWGFAMLRNVRARQAEARSQELVQQERNRIAREIHDVVAHSLSVIVTQAQGAELIAARSPQRAATALGTIAETARGALAEMRGVLTLMGPPQPALADLPELVERAGIPVSLRTLGSPVPLGPSAELAVYRLVQEALTNTMRHAGPGAAAEAVLDWQPGRLVVTVRDNGIGGVPRFGRGLTGMRERLAALDGSLEVEGSQGFQVKGVLPC